MKTKAWIDPIVEEVRAARRQLLREANGDLKKLTARLMKSQKRHGKLLVDRRGARTRRTS
jgi:hypothetical protein